MDGLNQGGRVGVGCQIKKGIQMYAVNSSDGIAGRAVIIIRRKSRGTEKRAGGAISS